MPEVVAVRLRYNPRQLWFSKNEVEAVEGDHVVVNTERGCEIGLAVSDAFSVTDQQVSELPSPLKPIIRVATDADLAKSDELASKDSAAMPVFRELIEQHELEMKPVCVEYLFEGDKAVFYFSSEERVDFRELVRDLASRLHVRVDMRQIGVRDEARLVGGYSHCGQELCCARMGGEFEPVSIRMAKEQDLPLNPLKISGVCGRLMCCLRYEFDAYKDFKTRAPKRNAIIETPLGLAKVIDFDTPREIINMRLEDGKQLSIPLSVMESDEGSEGGRPCRVSKEGLESCACPAAEFTVAAIDRELEDGEVAANTPDSRKPRRRNRPEDGTKQTAARTDDRTGKQGDRRSSQGQGQGQEQEGRPGRRRRRGGGGSDRQELAAVVEGSTEMSETDRQGERPGRRRRRSGSQTAQSDKRTGEGVSAEKGARDQGGKGSRQGNAQGTGRQGEKGARQQPSRQASRQPSRQGASEGGKPSPKQRQRPGQNSSGIRAGRGDAATRPEASDSAMPTRRPRRRHPGASSSPDAPQNPEGLSS